MGFLVCFKPLGNHAVLAVSKTGPNCSIKKSLVENLSNLTVFKISYGIFFAVEL